MAKNTYIYLVPLFIIVTVVLIVIKIIPSADNEPPSATSPAALEIVSNKIMDSTEKIRTDPKTLHFDAIVVDTHNDFIWQVYHRGAVFGQYNNSTQSDLPKFKEGGLDVQVFAVWIPMKELKRSYKFTVGQVERLKSFAVESPGEIEFASTYDDIIRITGESKICGLIGVEGGTVIGSELDNINSLFGMGVRYIGLTWNNSNNIATSAMDEMERGVPGGLTPFGFEVIKRMNEVGMLVDVSHLGENSFWDIIETSTDPVIASHSNSYTVNPHYRNLNDEQIKAIAKSGGVIQVNFHNTFTGGSSLSKIIEHIEYIVSLVGIDYVGIGSDFDGGITPPAELGDATKYPELTRALYDKGYTDEQIKKILGLNFLRVFKQVCG